MIYDNGQLTERWAKLIVDQLVKQGVRYFCLSPGSRNTPLLLAVAEHPHVQRMVHFDERGMAFHALGFAKATGIPTVMIVTSGTAVGNLLPAIMEASAAFIPLVVVTADRPPELRDNGANQTTDQVKLFAHHVHWSIDLACPESALSDHYVATSIAQAVYRSSHGNKGPVHINVMLREPFFSNASSLPTASFTTQYESAISAPSRSTLESWSAQISGIEKGLIVIGSLQPYVSRKPIYELAETLNWPIFADATSGSRSDGAHCNRISYYESILKTCPDLKPEAILHFGDRLVSKPLLEWTSTISTHFYGLIADHSCRHDPKHIVTRRIECSPSTFCSAILPFIPRSSESCWLAKWKECSKIVSEHLDTFFAEEPILTEPGIARWLSSHLTADWGLFLSNSMPIRDADNFLFP
ncbi:MAG TPA: 2-succinyl-5-enolpyruvyl-6-hydroxy-3-cyclohexene-1-carboxylic-acid synthase, partial [Rhabdochlamydiaceae bacterium]|nr:2-succinyl-5-enolpyruvyl-6-hydroxy-3-cyclohexene-1-carboxylic-acid synthase [Rhabdochlamydiaceae bacterium]